LDNVVEELGHGDRFSLGSAVMVVVNEVINEAEYMADESIIDCIDQKGGIPVDSV
jgi:hypothetical protein